MALTRKILLVSMSVVGLAGCGSDSDAPTAATGTGAVTTSASSKTTGSADVTRTIPQAAQPVSELIPGLEGLGAKSDCADVVKLINQADLVESNGGANARNCRSLQRTLDLLDGFEASKSAEFGTAAIIDGTAPGEQFTTVTAALDQTKRFKLLGIVFRGPQIDTKASPKVNFEAPAAAFVKALRNDDCTSARATLSPVSRLVYANLKQFCSLFESNFMTGPAGLGARLRADPAADLVDLGGTRNVHFFGLATRPAGYRTIVVGTIAGGVPRVSDVVPVER